MSCEVLSEVERIFLRAGAIGQATPELEVRTYPYVVVISQDCDLEWDHDARQRIANAGQQPASGHAAQDWAVADKNARNKLLDGVLLCVADEEDVVHDASVFNTKEWRGAMGNQTIRYHKLRECSPDADLEGSGFPPLVMDFKRFLTLPSDELLARTELAAGAPGRATRRSVLVSPFLEDVVSRFYNYQSRVALPDEGRA
jgi:hypothetical protein